MQTPGSEDAAAPRRTNAGTLRRVAVTVAAIALLAAPFVAVGAALVAARSGDEAVAVDPSPEVSEPREPSRTFAAEPVPGKTIRLAYRPAQAGPPVSLTIPSLGIDTAPVVPIPLKGGVLEPPPGTGTVGWWDTGGVPGSGVGRAVITGHTFSRADGLFDDLGAIEVGDEVTLDNEHGELRYRVESVRDLGYEEVAAKAVEIFGQSGPERLVLVTCTDFDGQYYHSNIIVTAAPVA